MDSTTAKIVGTVCSRIAVALLGSITGVIVSRCLQPDGRGAYFVILSIATTAMALGHMSLEQANVYLWPSAATRRSLSTNAAVLGSTVGAFASAAAFVLVVGLGPEIIPVASYRLLGIALAAVPAAMVLLYLNGLLTLDDRIGRINLATLLAGIAQCGILLGLAVSDRLDVGTAVIVWAASMALPLAVVLPTARIRPGAFSLKLARSALALGARYHLGMAALYLLLRIDIFLLNGQVSINQVGLYSLAVTLAEFVHLPTNAIAQVALPRQVAGSLAEIGRFTARVARLCCVAAALAMAGIVAAGPWLVPAVFGDSFADSVPVLAAIGPGVVALAAIRPVGGFLVRLNRPLLMSAVIGAATLINVGLNILLIPGFGIVGAGLASSVAYLLLAGCYAAWLCRGAGLGLAALLPRPADLTGALASLRGGHRATAAPTKTLAQTATFSRSLTNERVRR
jgi:O-antigen/teichoic acid export membrane protein